MEEFQKMELRDTYKDLDFKDLKLKRELGTGHGSRIHNVNVRQLGGLGSPRAKQTGSAFD